MCSAPVAYHCALESKFFLQQFIERALIMAAVLVIILIVAAHQAPCVGFLHGSLERRQVNLVQGTVRHTHVNMSTELLLVIEYKVLHAA